MALNFNDEHLSHLFAPVTICYLNRVRHIRETGTREINCRKEARHKLFAASICKQAGVVCVVSSKVAITIGQLMQFITCCMCTFSAHFARETCNARRNCRPVAVADILPSKKSCKRVCPRLQEKDVIATCMPCNTKYVSALSYSRF